MLRVSLLGEFSVKVNDKLIQVNASRLQSLLAYLLLKKEHLHSRAYLSGLFWPDSSETQARTNLRNLLHQLRQSLPDVEKHISLDSQTIKMNLDAKLSLDVDDFESALKEGNRALKLGDHHNAQKSLEHALSIYQGDLFPSCYDEWIVPDRERLRQEYQNALENLSNLFEDRRDYQSAILYAQRLLQQDPLRETSYRRLIRLYALNGDRASALRVFHTCATILQRELAVQPGIATQKAYEQLLGYEPQPIRSFPSTSTFSPLVGREKEWATLLKAWHTAIAGHGPRVVILCGEAGIGKTRLLEELLQWATRQGIPTANAHCYAAEGELAYSSVVNWLRANPLPTVDDVWLSEAAHLLPEILINRPDLPKPKSLVDAWQREHLFEALARILTDKNTPLLLEIDDLQWCDQDSLEFLHFLVRFQGQSNFLIVGSYRPEEVSPDYPLIPLLNMLRREGQVIEIDLHCLDETATHDLITRLAGREISPGIAQGIFQDTEGNPLFVVETVHAISPIVSRPLTTDITFEAMIEKQDMPPKVHSVLSARLGQLSPQSQELAAYAAVIGREFNFHLLLETSERDEESLVRQLDELWRKGVIREHGKASYDFSHDKLREVAYSGMSQAKRRFLHKRTAQGLENVYPQNIDSVSHQVAVHYEQAGMVAKALPYYLNAAVKASSVFANDDAINLLKHGLELFKEPRLNADDIPQNLDLEFLELLADIYALKTEHSLALNALRSAINGTKPTDPIRLARLKRKLGTVKREQRLYSEALQAYKLAEEALGDQPVEDATMWWDEWLEIKVEQVWAHYWLAEWPEMNELVDQVHPIVRARGRPNNRMRFLMASCLLHLRKERYVVSEEMLSSSYEALKLSQENASLKTEMECNFEFGFLILWRRNLHRAEKYLETAYKLAEKLEVLPYQTLSLTYLSIQKRFMSDVESAQEYSRRAREIATLAHMPDYLATSYGNDAWVAWRSGNFNLVWQLSDKAIEIWEKSPLVYPFQWIALWPMIGAALAEKNQDVVWNCVRKILEPTQQIFPEDLDVALQAAISAQSNAHEGESLSFLDQAIKSAKMMGYL